MTDYLNHEGVRENPVFLKNINDSKMSSFTIELLIDTSEQDFMT